MNIAVLGIGRMGAALAGRLLAGGHDITVWNRSPGKAPRLLQAGAREATSAREAVAQVDVVVTSLSDDRAVRQVALGKDGLRATLPGTSIYLETSTVSPALTEELSEMFPRFAAMPVLGGPASVESQQATYLLGASGPVQSAVEPVLPALGGMVRRYSSARLASTAKLAVNLLLLSGVASLAESFAVGRSGGLADEQLRELLSGVVAASVKTRFEAVLGSAASGWWTTALGAKDAALAVDLAAGAGVALPVGTAVRDAYLRVANESYSDEDIAAVRHLYEPRFATPDEQASS